MGLFDVITNAFKKGSGLDKFLDSAISVAKKAVGIETGIAAGVGAVALSAPALVVGGVAVGTTILSSTLLSSKKSAIAVVNAIIKTPSALANVGENIGAIIENPSIETVTNTFKENPVIVGGLTAAAALTVGKGLTSTVATILNTKAEKENTAAMDTNTSAALEATPAISQAAAPAIQTGSSMETLQNPTQTSLPKEAAIGNTTAGIPLTQPTSTITTGKKRYKKRKVKLSPSIHNNINIAIQNKAIGSQMRKYIKMPLYS